MIIYIPKGASASYIGIIDCFYINSIIEFSIFKIQALSFIEKILN